MLKLSFAVLLLMSFDSNGATCPAGEHWVRAHFRKSYYRSDGTYVSASNVVAHCKTNPSGYDFWQPKIANGSPQNWPHAKEVTKKWSDEEVERILDALADLPEALRLGTIKNIFRMRRSTTLQGNPATSSYDTIVLYDEAFEKKHKLAQVFAHEIAHRAYEGLAVEEKQDYHLATNWINVGTREKPRYVSRADGYVLKDGESSPEEDFANNIEYYLFDSGTLEKKTPQAFRWIKHHFGDKFKIRGSKK